MPEGDVVHSHLLEKGKLVVDMGNHIEELESFFDSHFQNIMDVFPLVGDGKGFGVKPFSIAERARCPHIIHKVHIKTNLSHPSAFGAGSFLDIEAKPAGLKACCLAFGKFCEEISDIIEDFDVGTRIGTRSSSNGSLIDGNDLVKMLQSMNCFVLSY